MRRFLIWQIVEFPDRECPSYQDIVSSISTDKWEISEKEHRDEVGETYDRE